MSLVEEMHAAHKARLHRMNACAYQAPTPVSVAAPVAEPHPQYSRFNIQAMYYHNMWFYDLVVARAPSEAMPLRIDDIVKACARYYNVSKLDIISCRRTADIVRPRQVACFLSKMLTGKSLPEIGRRIGARDHTTILHAVRKIDRLRLTDAKLESDLHGIAACLAVSL